MSKKSKKEVEVNVQEERPVVRKPRVVFRVMNNCAPVPVAAPADFIQLTPVVQPIPIVPYSSQAQPLAQFDDGEGYDDGYDDEDY